MKIREANERRARTQDPARQTYGPQMREKVLALAERWATAGGPVPARLQLVANSQWGLEISCKVGGLARDVLSARGGNVVMASEEKSARVAHAIYCVVYVRAPEAEETQEAAAPPPPPRPQSSVLWQPPQARLRRFQSCQLCITGRMWNSRKIPTLTEKPTKFPHSCF